VSLPLFLVDALPTGDACRLDGPEGHHATTVQRLRAGERLLLGNGRGGLAEAVVISAGRGVLELALGARQFWPVSDPWLVVVQALAKGDRGELAVQAMTEVGVDQLMPWQASRSVTQWRAERGQKALERWRVTAREAAKQARRPWVPAVSEPIATCDIGRLPGAVFVLHEEATVRLSTVDLPSTGGVTLVVGPEGGIAPEELAQFESAGAVPVRLGHEVLRTSTAGVAALAVLAVRLRRW
jgi:16S rRNA (uracil1498-N3)-methyltransferase